VWALLLSVFPPSLLVLDTMTAGGDTPSFHHPIAYLREVLLPSGNVLGWDPGNFGGYAPYRSYFLPPSLLVVLLSAVVPFNVAFKLVTVAGIFLLPPATIVCLRALGYRHPVPAIGAAASVLFLFNQGNSMWGGNVPSTLAGEFSFSIAFALAVAFLGLLHRGIVEGRHRARLACLLALTGLCHPLPFLTAAASGLYFLCDAARWRRNVPFLAALYGTAALLMAFWLVPVLAGLPYATSIHWAWQFQSWTDVLPPLLWAPALLAAGAVVRLIVRPSASGADPARYLLFSLLVSAAAFSAANRLGIPDIRFVPFAQMIVVLLALDFVATLLGALPAAGLPGLALVAATLGQAQAGAGYIPDWVRWNYEGIELKKGYPALQQITATLRGSLSDPRVGYEHNPAYEVFGSMRIFESLPHLAGRATLEGVLLQTTATSPFVYYLQSMMSEQGTAVIPGYTYPECDPSRGGARLDLFNVREFLASSARVKAALDADPGWRRLWALDPYVIYRRTAASAPGAYVRVPKFQPVIIETSDWRHDFHRWFDRDDLLEVPLLAASSVPASRRGSFAVARSPVDLPRVPIEEGCSVTESLSPQALEFRTTCPGVPHWISMAYHPNWRVEGAAAVMLASPAFMMVIPDQPVVRLRFARSGTDWLGVLLTLAGVVACVAMARAGAVSAPDLPATVAVRAQRGVAAILATVSVVAVALILRTVGAQYFAVRGWRAFQKSDFADARRQYSRALLFGRGHASSADAMFYRASSLYRLDDLPGAVAGYEDLLAHAPGSIWAAESRYQIGICRMRMGDRAAAIAAFQRARSEYEGSRWARLAGDRLREIEPAPAAPLAVPSPTPIPR